MGRMLRVLRPRDPQPLSSNLGLDRYVPAFGDNDIDAEVLRKLTVEDLISIGGPRSATGASCSTRLPASAWRFRPPW